MCLIPALSLPPVEFERTARDGIGRRHIKPERMRLLIELVNVSSTRPRQMPSTVIRRVCISRGSHRTRRLLVELRQPCPSALGIDRGGRDIVDGAGTLLANRYSESTNPFAPSNESPYSCFCHLRHRATHSIKQYAVFATPNAVLIAVHTAAPLVMNIPPAPT